jgi:hypothetical protein
MSELGIEAGNVRPVHPPGHVHLKVTDLDRAVAF